MPPLPLPIRVLRDAVVVMLCIVLGEWFARLPYGSDPADPLLVETFRMVFGTLGFALAAFFAKSRRSLQVGLTLLALWLVAGLAVALGGGDPFTWVLMLAFLPIMALLGAGLALLVERLAREAR